MFAAVDAVDLTRRRLDCRRRGDCARLFGIWIFRFLRRRLVVFFRSGRRHAACFIARNRRQLRAVARRAARDRPPFSPRREHRNRRRLSVRNLDFGACAARRDARRGLRVGRGFGFDNLAPAAKNRRCFGCNSASYRRLARGNRQRRGSVGRVGRGRFFAFLPPRRRANPRHFDRAFFVFGYLGDRLERRFWAAAKSACPAFRRLRACFVCRRFRRRAAFPAHGRREILPRFCFVDFVGGGRRRACARAFVLKS